MTNQSDSLSVEVSFAQSLNRRLDVLSILKQHPSSLSVSSLASEVVCERSARQLGTGKGTVRRKDEPETSKASSLISSCDTPVVRARVKSSCQAFARW
jgi:hypothetical protein